MPGAEPLTIGSVLDGRFEIVSELGAGGFGVVYRARQISTGQSVAIKLLHPLRGFPAEHARAETARFRREMELIGQLKHPNVVRLIDSGQRADGELYTVLEFVEGRELSQVIEDERGLTFGETRRLMGQVLEALGAAHALGIVHRDLKPQNIMVTRAGSRRNAMVLDFGIATVTDEARGQDFVRLTQTGQIHGTPAYMAPEQLEGRVSPQSDLYAWGLVFIECLTGQPVVQADSVASAIFRQLSPEPVAIPEELQPDALRQILSRACAKQVDKRYPSADALLADLEKCPLPDESLKVVATSPRTDRPKRATMVEDLGEGAADTVALEGLPGSGHIGQMDTLAALAPDLHGASDTIATALEEHAFDGAAVDQDLAEDDENGEDASSDDADEDSPRRRRFGSRWAVALVAAVLVLAGAAATYAYLGRQAGPPAESACQEGQEVTADTQGHCCWQAQAWNGERCVGIPESCPQGYLVDAAKQACSLPPCGNGQSRPDGIHCCWPEQGWSDQHGRCIGTPRCPDSFVPDAEQCLEAEGDTWTLWTSCDAGNVRPCVQLALKLQDGRGVERSDTLAAALLTKACEKDSPSACYHLGVAYRVGIGVAADPKRARRLLNEACEDATPEACYDLATLEAEHLRPDDPAVRVAELLDRACTAGHMIACDALAARLQHGVGVAPDPARATAIYEKNCNAGFLYSCTHLAWMLWNDGSSETRVTKALPLLEKACRGGESLACGQLASVANAGTVPGVDADQVPVLRSKACKDGWYEACDPGAFAPIDGE